MLDQYKECYDYLAAATSSSGFSHNYLQDFVAPIILQEKVHDGPVEAIKLVQDSLNAIQSSVEKIQVIASNRAKDGLLKAIEKVQHNIEHFKNQLRRNNEFLPYCMIKLQTELEQIRILQSPKSLEEADKIIKEVNKKFRDCLPKQETRSSMVIFTLLL